MKQPGSDCVDDFYQAIIGDSFPVSRRHGLVDVAHDGIDCHLITRFSSDRLKRVAKGVKCHSGPFQFKPFEQLGEFLGD